MQSTADIKLFSEKISAHKEFKGNSALITDVISMYILAKDTNEFQNEVMESNSASDNDLPTDILWQIGLSKDSFGDSIEEKRQKAILAIAWQIEDEKFTNRKDARNGLLREKHRLYLPQQKPA